MISPMLGEEEDKLKRGLAKDDRLNSWGRKFRGFYEKKTNRKQPRETSLRSFKVPSKFVLGKWKLENTN